MTVAHGVDAGCVCAGYQAGGCLSWDPASGSAPGKAGWLAVPVPPAKGLLSGISQADRMETVFRSAETWTKTQSSGTEVTRPGLQVRCCC